jgi:hypothetical protein
MGRIFGNTAMKKLLLFVILSVLAGTACAELKEIISPDGHRKLEWIDGYVNPVIERERERASKEKPLSDEAYKRKQREDFVDELIRDEPRYGGRVPYPKLRDEKRP